MVGEKKHRGENGNTLHAIGLLRKCLDDQFLVILPPSVIIGDNTDLRTDIFRDIFLVTGLVIKGDEARPQRFKTATYVCFWPTSGAYV